MSRSFACALKRLAFLLPPLLVAIAAGLLFLDIDSVARVRLLRLTGLDRFRPNPCLSPRENDLSRHQEILADPARKTAQILLIGDSLTSRWRTEGKDAWPLLGSACNLGVGADRVEHVFWRLTEGGELEGCAATRIVLLIGTNNLGRATPREIAAGVSRLVNEIRCRLPRSEVILLGVLPRGARASAPIRGLIADVNDRLSRIEGVRFHDLTVSFIDPGGNQLPGLFDDELHLSAAGFRHLAAQLCVLLQMAPGQPESS